MWKNVWNCCKITKAGHEVRHLVLIWRSRIIFHIITVNLRDFEYLNMSSRIQKKISKQKKMLHLKIMLFFLLFFFFVCFTMFSRPGQSKGLTVVKVMIDLWCHAQHMFLNDFCVCYHDLSEYAGLENIKQEFYGEPALKKYYLTLIWTSTSSSATMGNFP